MVVSRRTLFLVVPLTVCTMRTVVTLALLPAGRSLSFISGLHTLLKHVFAFGGTRHSNLSVKLESVIRYVPNCLFLSILFFRTSSLYIHLATNGTASARRVGELVCRSCNSSRSSRKRPNRVPHVASPNTSHNHESVLYLEPYNFVVCPLLEMLFCLAFSSLGDLVRSPDSCEGLVMSSGRAKLSTLDNCYSEKKN